MKNPTGDGTSSCDENNDVVCMSETTQNVILGFNFIHQISAEIAHALRIVRESGRNRTDAYPPLFCLIPFFESDRFGSFECSRSAVCSLRRETLSIFSAALLAASNAFDFPGEYFSSPKLF
ncbi:hypothetical protein [Agrobacterium tumefaciens]|uniref:hypothetical protein n=1 Tax=Agrobacterium tumefaciens TaxID=358 RepID=UPI0021D0AABE|nr:hypothetical protein [Agrobacterium tumefaciens]UXS05286.1 hypothetical protein FY156_27310 [Agrobacterium tumefaciens]